MGNAAAFAALKALQDNLEGLDKSFLQEVAREAAPLVEAAAKAQASKGLGPDGKAWHSKKDGSRALTGAADAISAKALGDIVQLVLTGNYVFSNNSTGERRRRILPEDGEIPSYISEAIRTAATRVWARRMGGR